MTGDGFAYALSAEGVQKTKDFFTRTEETEKELALLRARLEQVCTRRQQLNEGGPEGEEKEKLVRQLSGMETQILSAYQKLLSVEEEVMQLIRKLPDNQHRQLLEWKHLHHLSFFATAEKLHMDERHVYRVYKKALQSASVFYHHGL